MFHYTRSLGDVPGSRQPPFSAGISITGPICPVISSCCLSAGSLRFLILPTPTKGLRLPYGWPTEGYRPALQTSLGLPRFACVRNGRLG